jgi:hypothetical protein
MILGSGWIKCSWTENTSAYRSNIPVEASKILPTITPFCAVKQLISLLEMLTLKNWSENVLTMRTHKVF